MFFAVQDGSSSINLASERMIIKKVTSYAPSFFSVDEASIAQIELVLDDLINREKELQLTNPPKQLRPNVIASLERSLNENADVWAELSRH